MSLFTTIQMKPEKPDSSAKKGSGDQRNEARRVSPGSFPEQAVWNEPLAAAKGKEGHTGCVPVRITSFRRRLLDPDNLVGKFFLDCARYSGLLKSDTADAVSYSIRQIKVKTRKEERTEIEIGETAM